MRRIFFAFFAVIVLFSFRPRGKVEGHIDYLLGTYWCTNTFSCWHERGHWIDKQNNWISETDEYKIALLVYVVENKSTIDDRILISMVKEPRERYADIYAIFNGEVPDCLSPFYPAVRGKIECISFDGTKVCKGVR